MATTQPIAGVKVGDTLDTGTPAVRNVVSVIIPAGIAPAGGFGTRTRIINNGLNATSFNLLDVSSPDYNFQFGTGPQLIMAGLRPRSSLISLGPVTIRNAAQDIRPTSFSSYGFSPPKYIAHVVVGGVDFDFIFPVSNETANFEFGDSSVSWLQNIFPKGKASENLVPKPVLEIPLTIYPNSFVSVKTGRPTGVFDTTTLTGYSFNLTEIVNEDRNFTLVPGAYNSWVFPTTRPSKLTFGTTNVQNAAQDIRPSGVAPRTAAGRPVVYPQGAQYRVVFDLLQGSGYSGTNVAFTFAGQRELLVFGHNSYRAGTPAVYDPAQRCYPTGIDRTTAFGTPNTYLLAQKVYVAGMEPPGVGQPSLPRLIRPLGNIYTALRSGNAWVRDKVQIRLTTSSINTQEWGNPWVARKVRYLFAAPGPALTTTFGNAWASHQRRTFILQATPFSEAFGNAWAAPHQRTINVNGSAHTTWGTSWVARPRRIEPPGNEFVLYGTALVRDTVTPPAATKYINAQGTPPPVLLNSPTVRFVVFEQTIYPEGRASTFTIERPIDVFSNLQYVSLTYRTHEQWQWGYNDDRFGGRLRIYSTRTSLNINGLNSLRFGFHEFIPGQAPIKPSGIPAGEVGEMRIALWQQPIRPPSIVADTYVPSHYIRNFRQIINHDGYSFIDHRFGNQTRVKDLRQTIDARWTVLSAVGYPFIADAVRTIDVTDRGIIPRTIIPDPWASFFVRYLEPTGIDAGRGAREDQTTVYEYIATIKAKPVFRQNIFGTPGINNVTPELFVRGHDEQALFELGYPFISHFKRRVRPTGISFGDRTSQKPWVSYTTRILEHQVVEARRLLVGVPYVRFDTGQWPPPIRNLLVNAITPPTFRVGIPELIDPTIYPKYIFGRAVTPNTKWGTPVVYQFQIEPASISKEYSFGFARLLGGAAKPIRPTGMDYKIDLGTPRVLRDKEPQTIYPGWPYKGWEAQLSAIQAADTKYGAAQVQHFHREIHAFGWYNYVGEPTVRRPVPPTEFIPGVGNVTNVNVAPAPTPSNPTPTPIYIQVPVDGGNAIKVVYPTGIKSFKSASPRIDSTVSQEITPYWTTYTQAVSRFGQATVYDPDYVPPGVPDLPPPYTGPTNRQLRPAGMFSEVFGPTIVEFFNRQIKQTPPVSSPSKFGIPSYVGKNPRQLTVTNGILAVLFGFDDGELPATNYSKGFVGHRVRTVTVRNNWDGREYPRHKVRRDIQYVTVGGRGVHSASYGVPFAKTEWSEIHCRGWVNKTNMPAPELIHLEE